MLLLAVETATSTCGVAVMQDNALVAEAHLYQPRVHSERLTPLIEETLQQANISAHALDAVAVSMGPGSYTGLRIGVSTAKGWALAVGADLVGVPTLEAYAAQLTPFAAPGDVACGLIDARRDEVYAGAYRFASEEMVEHAPTKALTVEALPEWIGAVEGQLWLLGDGARKAQEAIGGVGTVQRRLSVEDVSPSAKWVARRGQHRLMSEGPTDLSTFEPFYVKDVHASPAPSPFA